MTRIIAGDVGGRRIQTRPGQATRPTSERVREAFFSAVQSMLGAVDQMRFLDLYAGSGAVGLEALSRGVQACTFVERNRSAAAVIRSNASRLGLEGVVVLDVPVERLAHRDPAGGPYDIVFCDPPYTVDSAEVAAVLRDLAVTGWLVGDATIVVERRSGGDWSWPDGYRALRSKRYGETMLWYGQWYGDREV